MSLSIVVAVLRALRLANLFSTEAGFWMNLQQSWDLYHAQQAESSELKYLVSTGLGC